MIIDCGSCAVRGRACADCVVTFLTIPVGAPTSRADPSLAAAVGAPTGSIDLDAAECSALTVLARSGLVPPLRMRPAI